jgi:uncharacterized phage protein (TIGR01671 family)
MEDGVPVYLSDGGLLEPLRDIVIEQYTGLKDKNGRKIYAGDILGGMYNAVVRWCDKCSGWNLYDPGYGCLQCEGDIMWTEVAQNLDNREVIGNIHENPELLQ